jgi:hypothetical protein
MGNSAKLALNCALKTASEVNAYTVNDGHVGPLLSSSDRRNYEENASRRDGTRQQEPVTDSKQPHSCRVAPPHSCNNVSRQATFAQVKKMRSRCNVAQGTWRAGPQRHEGTPNFWQPLAY